MYYEINVSLGGDHVFATSERSLLTQGKADALFDVLAQRLPAKDGYKLELFQIHVTGMLLRSTDET